MLYNLEKINKIATALVKSQNTDDDNNHNKAVYIS